MLEWPSVTLYGPGPDSIPTESGIAVHVLLGTEPSRGWKTFAAEVIDAIEAADVTAVVFLGAMLADVPHTRPISVFASSENAAVRDRFELERSTYEGPVGILSVLVGCGRAGRHPDPVDLGIRSPLRAQRALPQGDARAHRAARGVRRPRGRPRRAARGVRRLGERHRRARRTTTTTWRAYITQLEQARDTVDSPEASGEAIAEEFERYLRRRDGRDGRDGRGEPRRRAD